MLAVGPNENRHVGSNTDVAIRLHKLAVILTRQRSIFKGIHRRFSPKTHPHFPAIETERRTLIFTRGCTIEFCDATEQDHVNKCDIQNVLNDKNDDVI